MATEAKPHHALAAPHSSAQAGAASRVRWVDAARGLAILLVVFGHAAGGLIDASAPGTLPGLRYLFLAIYSFHMPVFFFLAGLFVEQRLQRGTRAFLIGLLQTLVYPYFLWATVQYSLIFALGSMVNHPASTYWGAILALPWRPISQFWFLQALFLIHLLSIIAWRLGGPRAVFGAALLAKLVVLIVPTTVALSLAANNAPYYAIGLLLGWPRVSALLEKTSPGLRRLCVFSALAALALLCSQANMIQGSSTVVLTGSAGLAKLAWNPVAIPVAVLSGAALVIIADGMSRGSGMLSSFVERLGAMTMPIFLLHVMFIAGLRILAERIFGLGGVAVLPLLVVAGLLGPLAARRVAMRLGLARILALR